MVLLHTLSIDDLLKQGFLGYLSPQWAALPIDSLSTGTSEMSHQVTMTFAGSESDLTVAETASQMPMLPSHYLAISLGLWNIKPSSFRSKTSLKNIPFSLRR